MTGVETIGKRDRTIADQLRPQHFLYFLPDPHGHGSLRPTFPKELDWVGGFDIGVEQRSPCGGAELHGLFEPLDPQLPQNVAVAIVDGEVRRITLRLLEKPFCDIIIVRHHERGGCPVRC